MATTRQKRAARVEQTEGVMRERRKQLEQREKVREDSAIIPEKGKAESEFTTLDGTTYRSILSPLTLATAMAQNPQTLLELPIVDKRGRVSAAWFRAGSILNVVDLTGLRRFPR